MLAALLRNAGLFQIGMLAAFPSERWPFSSGIRNNRMFPAAEWQRIIKRAQKSRSPCPHRMTGYYSDTGKSINLILPQGSKMEQKIYTLLA